MSSPIQILLADNDELREAAFSFRYKIYVEAMGRRQLYADHDRKVILEPQDTLGRIYVALDKSGRIVGTVRSNIANDPTMAYYLRVYEMDRFAFRDMSRIQITTKLMIDPSFARSPLAAKLIQEFAVDGYKRGVHVNFIDCNKPLVSFFSRMGYFEYCGWRFHKEFGTVKPMFHAVDAVSYLERTGSFLWKEASAFFSDNAYGGNDLVRKHATAGTYDASLLGERFRHLTPA